MTLQELKKAAAILRRNAVKPGRVKNAAHARRLNRIERELGTTHRWKVGDEFYVVLVKP